MFGIDGPELLVIIIVLLVVVGPKDLPAMLRNFGRVAARMRMTAQEFREQFNEAMREADMHDVADVFQEAGQEVGKFDPRQKLAEIFDPLRLSADDRDNQTGDADGLPPASVPEYQPPPSLSDADPPISSGEGVTAGKAQKKRPVKKSRKGSGS